MIDYIYHCDIKITLNLRNVVMDVITIPENLKTTSGLTILWC